MISASIRHHVGTEPTMQFSSLESPRTKNGRCLSFMSSSPRKPGDSGERFRPPSLQFTAGFNGCMASRAKKKANPLSLPIWFQKRLLLLLVVYSEGKSCSASLYIITTTGHSFALPSLC